MLKENTNVDNLMATGESWSYRNSNNSQQQFFKMQSFLELESAEMKNPSTILGLRWDKREDILEIEINKIAEENPVPK